MLTLCIAALTAAWAVAEPARAQQPTKAELKTQLLKLEYGNKHQRTEAAYVLGAFHTKLRDSSPERKRILKALIKALPEGAEGLVAIQAMRTIALVIQDSKFRTRWESSEYARFKREHPAVVAAKKALKAPSTVKAIKASRAAGEEQDFRLREAAAKALKACGE